jgi:hypothetical protein
MYEMLTLQVRVENMERLRKALAKVGADVEFDWETRRAIGALRDSITGADVDRKVINQD